MIETNYHIRSFLLALAVNVAFVLAVNSALGWHTAEPVAQCDTDYDCMRLCRQHDVNCDGGPE